MKTQQLMKPILDGSAGIIVSLSNALDLDISSAMLGKRGPKRCAVPTSIGTLPTLAGASAEFLGRFRHLCP